MNITQIVRKLYWNLNMCYLGKLKDKVFKLADWVYNNILGQGFESTER